MTLRNDISSSPAPDTRPRVVMLLANEFTHDTRVHKEARSLITWGCEVHIVAVAGTNLPDEEVREEIHVHRVRRHTSAVWRIFAALPAWWCRPALRAMFPAQMPVHEPPPGTRRHAPPPSPSAPPRNWPRPFNRPIRLLQRAFRIGLHRGRGIFIRLRNRVRGFARRCVPSAVRILAFNAPCVRAARALGPDVIVAHDLTTLAAAVIAKRIIGAPVVYDSHELFLERNIGDRSRARDQIIWGPVERFGIVRCDAVTTVADGIAAHLAAQYRIPKPGLIRNVQPYEPPAPRSSLLADELGIERDRPIVLYPGAITFNRGLEVMIDSAPGLDRAVYVVMGYARNPAYLKALHDRADALGVLGEKVYFRDAVPTGDVVRYTASAALGIVPTQNVCLSYGFEASNKIFHCLMAGVPVVMSDHSEKRLLVERHAIGRLFDERDPDAIARTVNETLADEAAYAAMRSACLEASLELNWEREEFTLRTIFHRLLGERAQPIPAIELPDAPIPEISTVPSCTLAPPSASAP